MHNYYLIGLIFYNITFIIILVKFWQWKAVCNRVNVSLFRTLSSIYDGDFGNNIHRGVHCVKNIELKGTNNISSKSVENPGSPLFWNKVISKFWYQSFKDTHREKAPSNKTPALTKNRNMVIWVVATSKQGS